MCTLLQFDYFCYLGYVDQYCAAIAGLEVCQLIDLKFAGKDTMFLLSATSIRPVQLPTADSAEERHPRLYA